MAKLKLSGRKLCTTGRKLSVCGCGGGGGPCCNAGRPCEINVATGPWFFKAWWQFQASGQRVIAPPFQTTTCAGGSYSGTYAATAQFPNLSVWNGTAGGLNNSFEASGPCFIQRVVQQTGSAFSNSFTNPGTITGNLTADSTQASATVQTYATTTSGGWPLQPSGTITGNRAIDFSWSCLGQSNTASEGNGSSFDCTIRLLDGALSVLSKSFGSTVTPYLVTEGSCVLGVGATFSYTQTGQGCTNPDNSNSSLANKVITGSVATAICNLAQGCVGGGTVCASATVPGAGGGGSLLDTLDGALFS